MPTHDNAIEKAFKVCPAFFSLCDRQTTAHAVIAPQRVSLECLYVWRNLRARNQYIYDEILLGEFAFYVTALIYFKVGVRADCIIEMTTKFGKSTSIKD